MTEHPLLEFRNVGVIIKERKILDAKENILTADVLSKFFAIPVAIKGKDGYYHAW